MKFGRGRAAVTGDKHCIMPLNSCVADSGRRGGRMTRKPEDLPEILLCVVDSPIVRSDSDDMLNLRRVSIAIIPRV